MQIAIGLLLLALSFLLLNRAKPNAEGVVPRLMEYESVGTAVALLFTLLFSLGGVLVISGAVN